MALLAWTLSLRFLVPVSLAILVLFAKQTSMNALPVLVKTAETVSTPSTLFLAPVFLGSLAHYVKRTSMNALPTLV
jgi:hypothetical protein